MSVAQVESLMQRIPVVALVNAEDQPFFTSKEGGKGVAFFFLDPADALLEMRVMRQQFPDARLKIVSMTDVYFPLVANDKFDVGGLLRLRPPKRQIVFANRALQYNSPEGSLMPITLDETKGQVPVFYSEKVSFTLGGETRFPFFLRKEDLDLAFLKLLESGDITAPGGKMSGQATGIPVGLTRVATLDGLVKQMRSGEVDLRQAVLVGSGEAVTLSKQLLNDGSAVGGLP